MNALFSHDTVTEFVGVCRYTGKRLTAPKSSRPWAEVTKEIISNLTNSWAVLYVEPRAESAVKYGIEEVGGEAFVPVERFRRRIEKRNLWKHVEQPIFSRYVFGRSPVPNEWGVLKAIDGVVDVLCNNDQPSLVSPAFIDALRKAEAYGVFDKTKNGPEPFNVGELVRVSSGPFAGHNVIIDLIHKLKSTTAKKRAKVLLDFMGRQSKFDVDVCELEKL